MKSLTRYERALRLQQQKDESKRELLDLQKRLSDITVMFERAIGCHADVQFIYSHWKEAREQYDQALARQIKKITRQRAALARRIRDGQRRREAMKQKLAA